MENDALFSNIPENTKHKQEEKKGLAQISNTSRQQIINNNSNSTNKCSQRLTADQLAKRTGLQRRSLSSISQSIYILFRQDVKSQENSRRISITYR
ncbi:hypothetical protein AVEN_228940-1 [Araneus ventricosus]|uniref:Uncharacterized protein n=1 Tax=Araneus ventricosus TaxID=182803 RepID=A0A4Y2IFZ7_ARAVE|nr:hypothetical protein AVEN_228940-1 [Araneus ventricosus]